jgi:hypothetical protein
MPKKNASKPQSPEIPVGARLKVALKTACRARLPVLLEGPIGIGESEIIQQVTRRGASVKSTWILLCWNHRTSSGYPSSRRAVPPMRPQASCPPKGRKPCCSRS